MRFFNMLDSKIAAECNNMWSRGDTRDSMFSAQQLKEFRKVLEQFAPNDWMNLESKWSEKPEPWKKRLAVVLEFGDPIHAVPLLTAMMMTNEKVTLRLAADCLGKFDLTNPKLSVEAQDRARRILSRPGSEQIGQTGPKELTPELALKFKAKIYAQKSLMLDRFLIWSSASDSFDASCFTDVPSRMKISEHLKAGIELANHFGSARRTYVASDLIGPDSMNLSGQYLFKNLHIKIVSDESQTAAKFSATEQDLEIVVNCELAREVAKDFRGEHGMEPPYEGWEIIYNHFRRGLAPEWCGSLTMLAKLG